MTDQTLATPAARSDLADLLVSLPECMGADVEAAVCAPTRATYLSCADVVETAERLGIDFIRAPFTPQQLHLGMVFEAEQRASDLDDLLDEDMLELGKIAATNLDVQPDFYVQLTVAHAPGDGVPVAYHLSDVGTD